MVWELLTFFLRPLGLEPLADPGHAGRGMLHNGQLSTITGKFDTWYDIIRYTFIFEPRPFIGLIFILPAILAVRYFRSDAPLFKPFLAGFLFVLWWFGFRIGVHMYNVLVLLPLVLWTIHTLSARHPRLWGVSMFCTGLASLTLFRFAALFPFYLHQGMPLAEARATFKRLDAQYPGKHYDMTTALFVLDDQYKRACTTTAILMRCATSASIRTRRSCCSKPICLTPAADRRLYRGRERLCSGVPRLFGVAIAHRIPGYQFALYELTTDQAH